MDSSISSVEMHLQLSQGADPLSHPARAAFYPSEPLIAPLKRATLRGIIERLDSLVRFEISDSSRLWTEKKTPVRY